MVVMPRDPRAAIIRKVFLFPANGDEPHIIDMEFNEAGAKHPYGHYTTAVDLRAFYGNQMRATRIQMLAVDDQPDERDEGEYIIYYNLSLKLPLNRVMARIAGFDPERPGPKLTWRGNVVAVKSPEPLIPGGGAHMDYVDVRPSVQGLLVQFIKTWYRSKGWENMLKEEYSHCK